MTKPVIQMGMKLQEGEYSIEQLKEMVPPELFNAVDERYSKEELVAEIGASFLCALCGIENKTINNSAAYIQGWLKRLNNDSTLIISASAQAQKAVDYILGISGGGNSEKPNEVRAITNSLL